MWVPILVYAGAYVTLFTTHILAAANDFDLLFRIVVALITLQTMLAGLCLHLLGGDVSHSRIPVVVLSAGLGWAYAGMEGDWSIAVWVLVGIMLQILTEKGLKYGAPAEPTDG
tara:strand:+ start:517 stop:855 length:339 start_codon:yes stop_codon:yes gene_type:complete